MLEIKVLNKIPAYFSRDFFYFLAEEVFIFPSEIKIILSFKLQLMNITFLIDFCEMVEGSRLSNQYSSEF